MYHLPELRAVYPDAVFVAAHRDPATVVASLSNLIWVIRHHFIGDIGSLSIGPEMSGIWVEGIGRFMRYHAEHPEVRVHDVSYRALMRDPIATVHAVYDDLDLEMTASAERAMRTFLEENPQDKHRRHRYQLTDFGLTREGVHERFAPYLERYDAYV
jgi:hypothetical protein